MAGSYKDLVAWRKAMRMALEIYRATRAFPKDETDGLGNQLRRAAVSVPSNIAEGQGRYSRREFQHFLNNARGSLAEIETQILLARETGVSAPKRSGRTSDESGRGRANSEWTDCGNA